MNSKFTLTVRIALGIILVIFGSNKFLQFIPLPDLGSMKYVFPIVGILEVLIGVMLLMKKWVAFAMVLLAPISINILLFHLFLDIPGLNVALIVAVLNGILIYKCWKQFTPLFT